MTQVHLMARRGPHEAGLSVVSDTLAVELAGWLEARGWRVEYLDDPPRLTLAQREVSSALFREYAADAR